MTETHRQKQSPVADFPRESESSSKFDKAADRIVRIDVDGRAWMKLGAAIAQYGDLEFKRLPPLKARGIDQKLLRVMAPLVSAEGKGRLYCAMKGWRVRIVQLSDGVLNVSADELLAFEDTLEFQFSIVGAGLSIASGGKVAVKLSGTGSLAIGVHGDAMVLPVAPGSDVYTDPHATVAWTDGLSAKLETDLSWRSLIKKGGGEAFQMHFAGSGDVVVQPSEDAAKFGGKKIKSLL